MNTGRVALRSVERTFRWLTWKRRTRRNIGSSESTKWKISATDRRPNSPTPAPSGPRKAPPRPNLDEGRHRRPRPEEGTKKESSKTDQSSSKENGKTRPRNDWKERKKKKMEREWSEGARRMMETGQGMRWRGKAWGISCGEQWKSRERMSVDDRIWRLDLRVDGAAEEEWHADKIAPPPSRMAESKENRTLRLNFKKKTVYDC